MNNQYIETGNNQRPSLTMWQYYRRAWTFPREKRASLREGNMVRWGMLLSSMILGFFITIIFCIYALSVDPSLDPTSSSSSYGKEVVAVLFFSLSIGLLLSILQFLTIPGIPLMIRRIHDSGSSAWLPLIGSMLLWPVYWYYMNKEGDPGTNKYGPPPSL